MRPLVIVGSSGAGRQIIGLAHDTARQAKTYQLIGFLDSSIDDEDVSGVPVVGGDDELATLDASYVIGAEEPAARSQLDAKASGLGREPATLIHSAAWIGPHTSIGAGSLIFETAHVVACSAIGRHVLMTVTTFAGHESQIGDHVVMAGGASVGARARIGNAAVLGSGCVVLDDVVVGHRAVIGANTVVTQDVAPGSCVIGVPARQTSNRRGGIAV